MTFFKKIIRFWWVMAIPAVVFCCTLLAVHIVDSIDYHNNDFFTFWLAGHMVAQGGNPYAPEQWVAGHNEFNVTWIPNQAYVYPLPLSLLFTPLGLLPLKQAYIAWVAFSELMILAALALLSSMRVGPRSGIIFLLLLLGTILFRPTILTLFNGQVSGCLLLLLAGTAILWEKGRWEWGSLLLPFLILKPNIGAPILILLGIWLLFQKRIRSILMIGSGLLALLVIGLIQNPHWVMDYWGIGTLKVAQNFGGSPTVWGLAALVCHRNTTCIFSLGGITTLLLVLGFLWLIARYKFLAPATILALAVTVTLLVTPYTWTYDQILLIIPIALVTLTIDRLGFSLLLVTAIFPAIDVLVVVLLIFNVTLQVEILNAIIPLVVLGLGTWFLTRSAR